MTKRGKREFVQVLRLLEVFRPDLNRPGGTSGRGLGLPQGAGALMRLRERRQEPLGPDHAAMGPIVAQFEGTIDHYGGDGIMVFFNDPLPTPDPARRAIDMAMAMRAAAQDLLRTWRRHGHDIGFGVGISQGYATLGQIGFAERMDYTAIGTVTNLAARLCGEAKDGQILVSRRVAIAVEDSATVEEIGDLSLKGLSQAVAVYNVTIEP
jgi:class 3 adenylate cyclase